MSASITVKRWRGPQFYATVAKNALSVMTQSAQELRAMAQARVPRATGTLAGSIQVDVSDSSPPDMTVQVYSDVPYAPLVEEGTKDHPAQPFLGPAAEAVFPRTVRRMTFTRLTIGFA